MLSTLEISTHQRIDTVDITREVQRRVSQSGVKEGLAVLFALHTTAALTINENADPDVTRDLKAKLSRLIPQDEDYAHGEGNSDAHIKSSLTGPSLSLVISGGNLVLGSWQAVYFCEFDGPRLRQVLVKVIEC